jgi:hypothetical protein
MRPRRSTTIVATAAIVALTVAAQGQNHADAHAALKSKRTYVTDYETPFKLKYRPKRIKYVIQSVIKNITWDSWGGRTARGRGVIRWTYCEPDCAGGSVDNFEVTLTLERRRVCGGFRRYTRLRWKFVNESPKPTKNVPVYTTKRMVCPH